MLKKSLMKKIFLILSCLFIIFILYLFPKKESENTPITTTEEILTTSIYLLDSNDYVSRVNVVISEKKLIEKAREIISYLTIGSKNTSYIKEGFTPIIPKNTKILSIDVDSNLIKINFSKDFYKIEEENEEKMLSAIIYSLTTLEGIEKVSIYIEDSLLIKLPKSGKLLSATLDRSYGINKIHDITSIKGSTSTTIYYLSKYKDYYYYVPVTVINNEKKEKIEVIITELTSKTMYQTNLISYLTDSKQISYEVTDEYMLIKLSEELYADLNNSNLMESVVYSMNLSIKENYNIKTVMYMTEEIILNTYFI